MINSNEDKHMHRVNKKYGYSEYGNNMYDIIIEDLLEDKVWPPQYMMPFIQKVSFILSFGTQQKLILRHNLWHSSYEI